MVPKQLKMDFFLINTFAQVYRKTQSVQPPNSNNLCGNGIDFCKSRKNTKITVKISQTSASKPDMSTPKNDIDVTLTEPWLVFSNFMVMLRLPSN